MQPRIIPVRRGRIQPTGSWLYVWMDTADGSVAHVGGTGYDPELRAHMHLTSGDPSLGRVRAIVPGFEERDFDVLAFALPAECAREDAKRALVNRLGGLGLVDAEADTSAEPLPELIDAIARAVSEHAAACRTA